MASLTKMIKIAKGNHYIPTYKTDVVIDKHMRLRLRQLPGANQKAPLRLSDALGMKVLDNEATNKELRNQVIVFMGLYSLCRASELLAITPNDLDFDKKTIFIGRAKNDQEGVGRFSPMSQRLKSLLQLYLSRRHFDPTKPLIRRLTKYDTLSTPLSYEGMYDCIKDICTKIYGVSTNYATHSLRIGASVSMAENGVPLIEIIQAGGWKTSTQPIHYTKQANTINKGMGRLV